MSNEIAAEVSQILGRVGFVGNHDAGDLEVFTPIDGTCIGRVTEHSQAEIESIVAKAEQAFSEWREVPAPQRGQLVRIFGELLRQHKEDLGKLVTIECGKIYQEGLVPLRNLALHVAQVVGIIAGITTLDQAVRHQAATLLCNPFEVEGDILVFTLVDLGQFQSGLADKIRQMGCQRM